MKNFLSLLLPALLAVNAFGQYADGRASGRTGNTQAQTAQGARSGGPHAVPGGSRGGAVSGQQVRPSIGSHTPMYSSGAVHGYGGTGGHGGAGGLSYGVRPPVTTGVYAGNRGTYYGNGSSRT